MDVLDEIDGEESAGWQTTVAPEFKIGERIAKPMRQYALRELFLAEMGQLKMSYKVRQMERWACTAAGQFLSGGPGKGVLC